jgi:MFS family permease
VTDTAGVETAAGSAAAVPEPLDVLVRSAWITLIAAVVLQVGYSTAETALPTLTGFVKSDLGLSAAGAASLFSVFMTGCVAGSYAAGVLADRYGEARVLVLMTAASGVCFLVTAALAFPVLYGALFVGGVLGSVTTPAGGGLVRQLFAQDKRGLAMGFRQAGVPIGGVISAALLPPLAHQYGWRSALVVAALICLAGTLPLAAAGRRLRRHPRAAGIRKGAVTTAIKLLTLWGMAAVVAQFALLIFLPLDVHQRAGLSLTAAAAFNGVVAFFGLAGRLSWGWAADRMVRFGRKATLCAAAALGVVAFALLVVLPDSTPIAGWVVVAALAGFAIVGSQSVFIAMLAESTHPEGVGAAVGFTMTFTTASIAASPPLLGVLADSSGSYRYVWGVVGLLMLVAFVPLLSARAGGAARS